MTLTTKIVFFGAGSMLCPNDMLPAPMKTILVVRVMSALRRRRARPASRRRGSRHA